MTTKHEKPRPGHRPDPQPASRVDESNDSQPGLPETPNDADESSDVDESDEPIADDDRWDVFILDDDSDPLPEYGDFWMPD